VLRDGLEVHDTRGEPHRETALLERQQQRPESPDDAAASALGVVGQQHEVDLLGAELRGREPGEAVPGRPDDDVDGPGRPHRLDESRRITGDLCGRDDRVDDQPVAVAPAHVEAHRPGVYADAAAHLVLSRRRSRR
jgi:hypothetical protein